MQHRQSGFSVLEILMIIVIVGLIGAVGWLFWDKQVNHNSDTKSNEVVKSSEKAPDNKQQKLSTFTADSIGVAFDYPSSWQLSDATSYPFKTNSPKDVHKQVTSPNGFSLVFSTISSDGFGGTGQCPAVSNFKNHGEAKLSGVYVLYMDSAESGAVLQLSKNGTENNQIERCMYQNIISVSEPVYSSDNDSYSVKPHSFSFGTFISYPEIEEGKKLAAPNEVERKEAVNILLSTRLK